VYFQAEKVFFYSENVSWRHSNTSFSVIIMWKTKKNVWDYFGSLLEGFSEGFSPMSN
jgi:hypothetical protein